MFSIYLLSVRLIFAIRLYFQHWLGKAYFSEILIVSRRPLFPGAVDLFFEIKIPILLRCCFVSVDPKGTDRSIFEGEQKISRKNQQGLVRWVGYSQVISLRRDNRLEWFSKYLNRKSISRTYAHAQCWNLLEIGLFFLLKRILCWKDDLESMLSCISGTTECFLYLFMFIIEEKTTWLVVYFQIFFFTSRLLTISVNCTYSAWM